MNKRQAKKRNKKFGCKKWNDARCRTAFYEKWIKPIVPPKYVFENILNSWNSEFDNRLKPGCAYFKKYLEKASKTRHATLKFLPEEFWAVEEEVRR